MSFLGWFNKFLRYEALYKSEINLVLRFEKCTGIRSKGKKIDHGQVFLDSMVLKKKNNCQTW